MSENSLHHKKHPKSVKQQVLRVVGYALWVIVIFVAAQLATVWIFQALAWLGVPLASMKPAVLQTLAALVAYILACLFAIGAPWWLRKRKTTTKELGLTRLPDWADIGLGPLAIIPYTILSAILTSFASAIPGFKIDQAQDVGFSHLTNQSGTMLAFITLVVLAPFFEELLFRGYLFGKLRARIPFWLVMVVVSLVFASLHIPGVDAQGHFQAQWNVAVDVFALSLVLCTLREVTGSIWAGILLHMTKNAIAFYFIFVAPLMIH